MFVNSSIQASFKIFCRLVQCHKNIFTSIKVAISLFKDLMIARIHLRACFIMVFNYLMTLDCFENSNLIVLLLCRINS